MPYQEIKDLLDKQEKADYDRWQDGMSDWEKQLSLAQEQYDSVKQQDDNIFASFAGKTSKPAGELELHEEFTDFCTESLAKVYADQGYTDKAVEIYSKLSLRYPEKSVYFASLIEKTEKKI